ncbi:hypothetical protein XhhCFBP4925_18880 [Xanthomonas hortorum pv. hederae]|nr:hypothetical protein XhhCFBP4925_18880 [Xanthomonas hortorum pv. hederae]PUF00844.1 hypothetical protein C7T87_06010 [Xanthomonas hortorum pv. hederae]
MAHGSWLMAHGSWLMAHGSWLMTHGPWPMAHGPWLPMIDALHSRRMSGTKQKARSDAGFLFPGDPCPHPPFGHLLPRGEGLMPLSRRERGWGEGTAAKWTSRT